ncbi:MAG TPA: glycoside hydrolase family 15 protein [Nitrospiraceae bacterium]|jgi:GH15 family glucan-1,4-alpha-glucosidase|nr:glycoside hydrolase family 15 protein [Nitrospiraceae bacterium]
MTQWAPLRPIDGYLPIEDHGLIGDGATAALVGRDGAVSWLCVPRFDSPPLFCHLLDATDGGAFTVAPEGMREARQFYEADSAVLVTEMRTATGTIRVTDAFPLRSGADLAEDQPATRRELLRSAVVLEGQVRLRIEIAPHGGAEGEPCGDGVAIRCKGRPDLDLHLSSTVPLKGLCTVHTLQAGQSAHLLLRWTGVHHHHGIDYEELLRNTRDVWRRWMQHVDYHGPQEALVRRAAITLKLLDHFENGAIVAAPTSSLPEAIGGPRNWDYRYAWIRDAAFSVYALHRIGLSQEAAGFLGWVLDAVDRDGRPRVLYTLDGKAPPPERVDTELEGYRRSRPVRWGNAAADQRQHDVYGEIMDCAYQWAAHHGRIDPALWGRLRKLADAARREWRTPDHGIWEVRTDGRLFTYSAALCQVALDRAARLAERFQLPGHVQEWRAAAEGIGRVILEEAWDENLQSLTEHLGGGGLDASLLSLPLRRVVLADHPKMVATTRAIADRLGAGQGLLYRYLPDESPDGLAGHEGAFLLCSFWLVDNLAKQGQLDAAMDLYDSLCARANGLGLLPEEIDPATGAFLGNYPQAFSHIGVIASGVNLGRLLKKAGRTA